jgi:hypothetical protein
MAPGSQQVAGAMADGTVRIWDARPLTPEIEIDRRARFIVDSAFRNDLELEHAMAMISADETITDEVRQKALKLARTSATAYLDRAVVAVIDPLFARPLFRDEVIEALRDDRRLTDPVRRHALALAVDYPENVERLVHDCDIAVAVPGRTSKQYERALREAETICRLQDRELEHWSLLAMAQYRVGQYSLALATFQAHSQLGSPEPYVRVRELSFMAMAQHRLSRADEARKTLAQAREIMKRPFSNARFFADSLVREAESVTAGSQAAK